MGRVRVLSIALTALAIAPFPVPAKSLPGSTCNGGCSVWFNPDGTPDSECDDSSNDWASCSAIIHCDRDNTGHWINCEGQCQGQRCIWV
jgi:hypothetical protein